MTETLSATVYDARACQLGEGPLWHPERRQLFWFDIMGRKLLAQDAGAPREWSFPGHVSAAGWIDAQHLLVASETGLLRFGIETGATEPLAALEADDPRTRSNDGRADPFGGFWIGTMGKNAEPGLGAIYRYYGGELRRLYAPLTIPNAICFSPDGGHAFFTDTATRQVMRTRLGRDGWPEGEPQVWLDLRAEALNPDGAVIDTEGGFWLAEWGAARVCRYTPDGRRETVVTMPAAHGSCPAFGGPDLATLHCTSALQGVSRADRARLPDSGKTFAAPVSVRGQPEHRIRL